MVPILIREAGVEATHFGLGVRKGEEARVRHSLHFGIEKACLPSGATELAEAAIRCLSESVT